MTADVTPLKYREPRLMLVFFFLVLVGKRRFDSQLAVIGQRE